MDVGRVDDTTNPYCRGNQGRQNACRSVRSAPANQPVLVAFEKHARSSRPTRMAHLSDQAAKGPSAVIRSHTAGRGVERSKAALKTLVDPDPGYVAQSKALRSLGLGEVGRLM